MSRQACLLCGADTGEISMSLVEWAEPINGRRWESLPHCRDREACWSKVVHVLGEDWPVADGRPRRAPAASDPEPVQTAEPPPADVPMEDPEWLTAR